MSAFAIDFDDTYTADVETFNQIVETLVGAGHFVCVCTARRDTEENRELIERVIKRDDLPIYCTGLRSKLDYMASRGVKIDIWMDDDPRSLVRGH